MLEKESFENADLGIKIKNEIKRDVVIPPTYQPNIS